MLMAGDVVLFKPDAVMRNNSGCMTKKMIVMMVQPPLSTSCCILHHCIISRASYIKPTGCESLRSSCQQQKITRNYMVGIFTFNGHLMVERQEIKVCHAAKVVPGMLWLYGEWIFSNYLSVTAANCLTVLHIMMH